MNKKHNENVLAKLYGISKDELDGKTNKEIEKILIKKILIHFLLLKIYLVQSIEKQKLQKKGDE